MEIEVVKNRLWVDLGACIGQLVSPGCEAELPPVDAIAQAANGKPVDSKKGSPSRILEPYGEITRYAFDSIPATRRDQLLPCH